MALPAGFTAATLTAGPVVDMRGDAAALTAEVVTDFGQVSHITNRATGAVVVAGVPLTVSADANGVVTFTVPHVDSEGWLDPAGNEFTGWKYVVRISAKFAGNKLCSWVKEIQPLTGQTEPIDVDLVPGGQAGAPQTAVAAPVLSVNGQTQHVTLDLLPDGGLSGQVLARDALGAAVWVDPPEGGATDLTAYATKVYADQAEADAVTAAKAYTDQQLAAYPLPAHDHGWGEITDKPATYPPSDHGHTIGEVDGLWAELESKPEKPTTAFIVRHNGTAWDYPTLADAEAAGLVIGQMVQFVGIAETPGWARAGDLRTVIA